MSEKARIVVVDDHPLFRSGVVQMLKADPSFELVGQGATAAEAVQLAKKELPELLLLDIDIPGGGLSAAEAIAASCPVTKVVMLTVSQNEENLAAALKAGARAYILKGVGGRELSRILLSVRAGEVYVTPTLATSILFDMTQTSSKTRRSADAEDDLTAREMQIVEQLAAGKSNREIGEKLFLSEKTVKHYMTNILQKLQVRNRVEAALKAQRSGFGQSKA
jgi:two-component system, NarL family, nitrate/nitrite response regulator NarL